MKKIIPIIIILLVGCSQSKQPIPTPEVIYVTVAPQIVDITATPQPTSSPEPPTIQPSPTSESTDDSVFFVDSNQHLGPAHSWDVALGDLDGDGDLDAFTPNDSLEGNKIWFNDGRGHFTTIADVGLMH